MTRVIPGRCLRISINHVTFEIEVGLSVRATQTQQDFDTSLFDKNGTDATVQIFFVCATDMRRMWMNWVGQCFQRYWGQPDLALEKITHQRSPHSWHTPWLSKACSLSPSPERGRGRRDRGQEGEKRAGEWIHTENHFSLFSNNYQVIHVKNKSKWE